MGEIVWDKLSETRRKKLSRKIFKLYYRFSKINYSKPAHTNVITKLKYAFCRLLQKKIFKNNPEYIDAKYWFSQGWFEKKRPWHRNKKT